MIRLRWYYSSPAGRIRIDALVLKVPILVAVMRKIAVARFSRTLGRLITSGVPVLEAIDIAARTSGNAVTEKATRQVRKAIEEGRTVVNPLEETGVFPNMVVQMIGVGKQT
ncbi:MAG: type II secretion system F family protein [Acidobacteria bacterium]|nr:type II secretion system F family protein [Acidobacteriota bacterium]